MVLLCGFAKETYEKGETGSCSRITLTSRFLVDLNTCLYRLHSAFYPLACLLPLAKGVADFVASTFFTSILHEVTCILMLEV